MKVDAEILPKPRRTLGLGLGRDVQVTYLPPTKTRSVRSNPSPPAATPQRSFHHRTYLSFEPVDGRRGGPIEMVTPPVAVLSTVVRLVFPKEIQERIAIDEIFVERSDEHERERVTRVPVPTVLFEQYAPSPSLLRPGDRMRMRVKNISHDRRRSLRIYAALVLEMVQPLTEPKKPSIMEQLRGWLDDSPPMIPPGKIEIEEDQAGIVTIFVDGRPHLHTTKIALGATYAWWLEEKKRRDG